MNNKALFRLLLLALLSYLPGLDAVTPRLESVKWSHGTRARLLLDFTGRPSYRISGHSDPARTLIELNGAVVGAKLSPPPPGHPATQINLLAGKKGSGTRIQVDLRKQVAEAKTHIESLPGGVRLVVEWPVNEDSPKTASSLSGSKTSQERPAKTVAVRHPLREAPFVVAIDAGHGGKDTGAIGPTGVQEKTVVLAIARKLSGFVKAEPGMRAVMVRSGDHFVDLRHRAAIARRAHADLFVSLHADAYENAEARGSSVFTLSDNGASSEAARWLADSENAALMGGVRLKDKSKTLASVLVDLSKNATQEASDQAAAKVLRELGKDFEVHNSGVQKAGFVVLKSLDVPSMLVETAFISNPAEEKNLTNPKSQDRIAKAIFKGIRAYAAETRPPTPRIERVAEAVKE